MDKELSDAKFIGFLERTGILKAVAISRILEGLETLRVLGIWYAIGALLFILFSSSLVS